jgi:hypothetical protein
MFIVQLKEEGNTWEYLPTLLHNGLTHQKPNCQTAPRKEREYNPLELRQNSRSRGDFHPRRGIVSDRRPPWLINIFLIAQNLKLRGIILEDDKQRWKRISMAMGKSQGGCKKQARALNLVI